MSRWASIGAFYLFWLDGEKRKPLILLMWVEGLSPLLTSNKCQRDNALLCANTMEAPACQNVSIAPISFIGKTVTRRMQARSAVPPRSQLL